MADLIDRQAALKELAVYIHLIDKTMGKGTLTDDDCMEAAKSVLGEDELPAVQPDHNADIGKKVADEDCISRQAAIDAMGKAKWAKERLMELPSVQPEFVRCRDCKWKQGSECVRFAEVRPFPDDFCSRAERRTE